MNNVRLKYYQDSVMRDFTKVLILILRSVPFVVS